MTETNSQGAFLRGMRAIREFRPEPVAPEIIDDILEVARWTGSAMNSQPWRINVVRDRDTLPAMAGASGYVKHLATASAGFVLVMKGAGHEFDEGRLAERICLAATAHGVGAGLKMRTKPGEARKSLSSIVHNGRFGNQ
jgi:hypothetical protein